MESIRETEAMNVTESGPSEGQSSPNNLVDTRAPRRNQSSVWMWFTKLNREKSLCKTCGKNYETKAGGTTSLRQHMEMQHGDAFRTTERDENRQVQATSNVNGM